MLRKKGIAFKFIVAVSGVTQVLLVVLAAIVLYTADKTQRQQLENSIATLYAEQEQQQQLMSESLLKKGESLAALLAQTGAAYVVGYDFDGLLSLGGATLKDSDIVAVVFTGKDGSVLSSSGGVQGTDKKVKQDLIFDGESIGVVEVSLTFASVTTAVDALDGRIEQLVQQANIDMAAGAKRLMLISLTVIGVIVLVLCGAIYLSLNFFVIKPVMDIVNGINDSAEQVKGSSGQLAGASQQLADGASRSAASIEETSSSLEEVSSMTRRNTDNANQCDALMVEVNDVVLKSNQSMADQRVAMEEISRASEATSKIVKTIDEIAFQTNLLALNAAVEAARAGEAGAGIAVVADEVRNLAMRAAKAAQDTAVLIEGTVNKVHEGETLARLTDENFSKVSEKSLNMGSLIHEIAVASGEQNTGVSGVNTALGEIDQVTQQTAASSEEAASASDELSDQALHLEGYVHDLVVLNKGGRKQDGQAASSFSVQSPAVAQPSGHQEQKTTLQNEKMIPFDEGEF
ncbi:MAG: methyl-accepting chemotaxis protein [Spirochaetales bacterium]|jgi:methyl-accepting chemotaxis protein|nr:methyl-accepting chemotaxis protein [Spirochaetales bacterium]